MVNIDELKASFPKRAPDSHKGDFGHVFILAGSPRYSGAAVLCSEAAMRAGAGMVTLGIPEGINQAIIRLKPKEVMTLPLAQTKQGNVSFAALSGISLIAARSDTMVVGPGLGQEESTQKLIRGLMLRINKPTVLDADGINAFAKHPKALKEATKKNKNIVLTPHPGEMARLLGVAISRVQKNRKNIAQRVACDYNVTVVLKGQNTVVTDAEGEVYVNNTGNPGMATAGSGDVLTGIIAAFLGQKLKVFEAAKYAVYLHGLAGDLAAEEKTQISLIASDIIGKIPGAIKRSS